MADTTAAQNVFRVTPEGTYVHNNETISKEEYNARKAAVDADMKRLRGEDRSKMSLRDRSKAAFSELEAEGKAKGGVIKSASARADGCCIRGKTRA
jgi:galactokinase